MNLPPNNARVLAVLDEKNAHIDQQTQSKLGYKNVLVRRWKSVEPELRGPCVAFLREYGSVLNKDRKPPNESTELGQRAIDSMVDPMATQHPRDGRWYFGPVDEQRQPDGTVDIIQTLFRASTEAYLTQVVEDSCSVQVERKLYLNSATRPTVPSGTRPAGVKYRISEIMVDPTTGAFTGWLDTITRQYQLQDYFVSEEDTYEQVQTKIQLGVTNQTVPDADSPGAGEILKQDRDLNDDCSKDVVTKKATGTTVTDAEKTVEVDVFGTRTTTTDVTESAAETTPPVPEAGEVKAVTVKKSKYNGKFDNTVRVESVNAVEHAIKEKIISFFATETRVDDVGETAAETEQTEQTAGQIKTTTSEKMPHSGRFKNRVVTKTATKQEWDASFASRYGTVTVKLGRNVTAAEKTTAFNNAALDDSTDNDGTRWDYNDFGLIDYIIIKRPYLDTTNYVDTTWEGFGQAALKDDSRNPLYDSQGRRFVVLFYRTSSQSKAKAFAQADTTASAWSGSPPTFASVTTNCHVMSGAGGHVTGWYYQRLGRWLAVRVDGYNADFPQNS